MAPPTREALMSSDIHQLGIDSWSVEDKLRLIGEIWDSLEAAPMEIPEAHREILDQRLAEADANPSSFRTWEEVRERLLRRPE
jgi:putative addiction module component (TIGR02574 family)